MVLMCVAIFDNEYQKGKFTLNKKYEVSFSYDNTDGERNMNYFELIDDNGINVFVNNKLKLFITLDEYRDNQLNKIL